MSNKEPYYFGVFLVGAYQEILGDLHNLFGDTNAVHIKVKNGEYVIDKIIEGETVADVLEYVQFTPKRMARTVEVWATTSVKKGIISPVWRRVEWLQFLPHPCEAVRLVRRYYRISVRGVSASRK